MRSSAALVAALLTAVCATAPPPDPAQIERGRKIFIGTCAGYCHVARGQGLGNAPDLLDCDWRHGGNDADILAVIRNGVPGTAMLGFAGKLPDADLQRVLAYLRAASRCRRRREVCTGHGYLGRNLRARRRAIRGMEHSRRGEGGFFKRGGRWLVE
jgi:mono/diheme cytochrome c family protein